jgi:TPP-dependent indolepyruvate ferredoxin oxidoreductase alpha subunit
MDIGLKNISSENKEIFIDTTHKCDDDNECMVYFECPANSPSELVAYRSKLI